MRQLLLPGSVMLALALGGCGGSTGGGSTLPQAVTTTNSAQRTLRAPLGATSILPGASDADVQSSLCTKPSDGAHAGCFATVRTDSVSSSALSGNIYGLTPHDLSVLYAYPSPGAQGTAGSSQTVAVVVVGDYALAENDLSVYRTRFGLPACTSASGCLRKINSSGASFLISTIGNATSISAHPTTASGIGWAAETDADIETISAVCPNCKILISEAASSSIADLSTAVANAAHNHANVVNASFGTPESLTDLTYSYEYANVGTKVVAAAGDWGYGVYYPASDPNVISVGGTSLSFNNGTVSETAWSGTGSGCSGLFATPYWQHLPLLTCLHRAVADVSADANPLTGVAVYDSSLFGSSGGWSIFGGTSIAAPIISGMYALSGDTARNSGAQTLYSAPSSAFLGVTSGSNGSCSPQYLCTAGAGYNGPTGLGVPQGLGGF